jgi:hypothetical protein
LNKIGSETIRITTQERKIRRNHILKQKCQTAFRRPPNNDLPIQEEIQNHDTERQDLVTKEEIEITKNTCQRPPKVQREEEKSQISSRGQACMSLGMQGIQRRELMKKHRRETGHEPLRDCGETPMVKEQDHRSPTARLPAGGDG